MKTNKISIAMVVVLLSTLVFASAAFSAAPDKEPKEPPLEKEYKFKPFKSSELKKKKMESAASGTDDIKMSKNGRVISTGTELVFLNDMGDIVKRKPINNGKITKFSPDGTRMSQNIPAVYGHNDVTRWLFKIYDENGDLQWEKKGNVAWESNYFISQANNGVVVVPSCVETGCFNYITLYNDENEEGTVITPDVANNARQGYFGMSDDGNYFAIGYPDVDHAVAYFDISGKQLWVKKYGESESPISDIGVSTYGNYVIVPTAILSKDKYYIYIYNKQGDLLLKDEEPCPNCFFSFDNNESYAVVNKEVSMRLYDLKKSTSNFKIKHAFPVYTTFDDVDISSGFFAVVASAHDKTKTKSSDQPRYVFLYDINGELLYKKKIVDHGFQNDSKPQVKLIDNGRKILVMLGDKVRIYKNDFAK